MRRIIASEFVSADGYIEGPKGDMTWVTGSFNDEMGKYAGGSYGVHGHGYVGKGDLSADGHCLAELDRARVGWMNNSPKVVLSKTLRKAPWGGYEPARIISDGVEGEMRELKEKSGKNIVIYGSANAVQSLTRMGVIDEYR